MGLFGALFAGVSGLDSQSNKIGIISNNISNVNTVGFKQGQAAFDTLVVPSATTGTFSPGGVIGANQQLVNQQGIISATSSPTDVAISGGGFLVVNTAADGTGQTLYTRAGSFTQDENGDFVNSDGYFLQALPILANGKTAQANTQNLKTVSISQSASGAATATSSLTIAANLDATQAVLLGNSATATMSVTDGTSSVNQGATADQIIIGNDVPGTASVNDLVRTDTMNIVSSNVSGGAPQTDTFTYGGFNIGRSVTTTSDSTEGLEASGGGLGDGANVLDTETNQTITNVNGQSTVTLSVANGGDFAVGGYASISGVTTTIAGLTQDELNGEWKITATTGTSVTVRLASTSVGTGGTGPATTTVSNRTYPFTGNILNATSASGDFMGSGTSTISPSIFAPDALKFSITVGGGTPSTFTYSSTPNPSQGTFNSMDTLAQAISDAPGLTATVSPDGRLYVSSTDANQQVLFTNGDVGRGHYGFPSASRHQLAAGT